MCVCIYVYVCVYVDMFRFCVCVCGYIRHKFNNIRIRKKGVFTKGMSGKIETNRQTDVKTVNDFLLSTFSNF